MGGPVHYIDGLTRFYFDTRATDGSITSVISMISILIKYPAAPIISFLRLRRRIADRNMKSPGRHQRIRNSLTEIRYSTTSLKAAGFESGTDGGTVSSTGNAYVGVIWLSPNMPESPTGLYVGIQPQGQSAFTEVYIPPMNITSGGPTCDVTGDSVVNNSDVTAESEYGPWEHRLHQ